MKEIKPEKIKMDLGNEKDIESGDIIYLPMNPFEVKEMINTFKSHAERGAEFDSIKRNVESKCKFEKIIAEWERRRKEKDKNRETVPGPSPE